MKSFELLESQRQLLERFRYLTEYGEHLLVLHGPTGAGKSTLATSALATSGEFNQAWLALEAGLTPATIRERLVRQLVSDPVFDPEAPLTDSLFRLLPRNQRVLVMLDDAHHLPDETMAELLALVLAEPDQRLPVTVVLVADSHWVSRLHGELPAQALERLLPVEIPALSPAELAQLHRGLEPDSSLASDDLAGALLADGRSLTPGALLAWLHRTPRAEPRTQYWPFVLAALLSLGVAALWLTAPESLEDDAAGVALQQPEPAPQDKMPATPVVIAPLAEPLVEKTPDLALAGEWSTSNQILTAQASPERIEGATPALPAEEAAGRAPGPDLDAALAVAANDEDEKPSPDPDEQAPEAIEPAVAEPAPEALPLETLPLAERPAASYLLQLGIYSTTQGLDAFLAKNDPELPWRIYRIERSPKPWYVVTLGGFPDKASAQLALAELPGALRQLEPYIKSLKTVQRELAEEWRHPRAQ